MFTMRQIIEDGNSSLHSRMLSSQTISSMIVLNPFALRESASGFSTGMPISWATPTLLTFWLLAIMHQLHGGEGVGTRYPPPELSLPRGQWPLLCSSTTPTKVACLCCMTQMLTFPCLILGIMCPASSSLVEGGGCLSTATTLGGQPYWNTATILWFIVSMLVGIPWAQWDWSTESDLILTLTFQ